MNRKELHEFLSSELPHSELVAFENNAVVMIPAASIRKLVALAEENCYRNKNMLPKKKQQHCIYVSDENMQDVLAALKTLAANS